MYVILTSIWAKHIFSYNILFSCLFCLQQSMNEVEQELLAVRSELARVNGTIKIKETQVQDQDTQLRETHAKVIQKNMWHR